MDKALWMVAVLYGILIISHSPRRCHLFGMYCG